MKQLAVKPAAKAVEFLRSVCPDTPAAAVVLGSGVEVLENLGSTKTYSYDEVFGVSPGVVGHAGSLSIGKVGEKTIAVLRGRFHLYEGYDWDLVTLPARVVVEWGIKELYLTNAAGGINQDFQVGDLMLLTGYRDHLNPRLKATGLLPALKANAVDCRNALTAKLEKVGNWLNGQNKDFRPLRQGVYAALLGPTYETLAEIEMLRRLQADAVGMSTVPEFLAVQGTNTTAAALSVVTNIWSPDQPIGGHEEVLEAAREASQRLDKLFRNTIANL